MYFKADAVYHVYNRSNEIVFFNRENYLFFLKKIKDKIYPLAEILAWVLMPNHFHILLVAREEGCQFIDEKHRPVTQLLSKNIGIVLSSYSQAINIQNNRKGKLFSHNTVAKCLNDIEFDNTLKNSQRIDSVVTLSDIDYLTMCFNYIHQNPVNAGLVSNPDDWEFSSFRDFSGLRNGKLVNKKLALDYTGFDNFDFQKRTFSIADKEVIEKLF